MKIHYFSGSTLPSYYANTVHVMHMACALAEYGADITLFGKRGPLKTDNNIFDHYGVPEHFALSLSPLGQIPVLGGIIRIVSTILKSRHHQADLVYGRDLWTMALSAGRSVPMVFEAHQMPASILERWAFKRIIHADNFAGLVVISEGLKADMIVRYPSLDKSRILVAHDGARMYEAPPVPAPLKHTTSDTINAGYAGSLHPGKGVEFLIKLARATPDIQVHIFGGTNQQIQTLQNTAPPNIHFYGHIAHKDLPEYLTACDVLLAPYQQQIHIGTGVNIARWISPLKLFEYMAAARPIVCSNLPILQEIITHKQNGLMAEVENIESWQKSIKHLKNNDKLSSALTTTATSDLKTRYSWAVRAHTIIAETKRWIS